VGVAAPGDAADWKAYARASMTPAFAWATVDAANTEQRPAERPELLREATRSALVSWSGREGLSLAVDQRGLTPTWTSNVASGLVAQGRSAFVGTQTSTTLRQSFGADADVALTAIVARNRFATPGMGNSPWQSVEQFTGVRQSGVQEVSEGGGVEMAFNRALGERLSFNLSLQTRIDMDAFKAYRGIYSEAGDFDLPGHARTGLVWAASERFALGADIQRVMYSSVDTFTPATLPTRFLALLGDGSSPEFAWRDLTVYSAEAAVIDDFGGRWSLRYSTQQQPRPTSALLSRALADQYSDINLGFGYQRAIGGAGHFQLAASYAPAAYFMAPAPFVQRDFDGGSQFEVEAQWTLAF